MSVSLKKSIEMICQSLIYRISNKDFNSGVVLSFDDYFPEAWEQYFDLFDKYNAKVTFFVTGDSPASFCLNAQERGHEIGYHTISHPDDLRALNKEEFFEQTVSCIDVFRKAGIELTTFAYPHGKYEEWMNDELLKYYKIVRGFYGFNLYTRNDVKLGFIESCSVDNVSHTSDLIFKKNVTNMLRVAKMLPNAIVSLTSHNIDDSDWGIEPERLEFILRKGQEFNLKFLRYKDLL